MLCPKDAQSLTLMVPLAKGNLFLECKTCGYTMLLKENFAATEIAFGLDGIKGE